MTSTVQLHKKEAKTMRLTKSNIQKILDKNEGYETWTHNSQEL